MVRFTPKQPTWSRCRAQIRQQATSQQTWAIQIGEVALKEIFRELVHKIKISCKYRNKTKPGFISEYFLMIGKRKHIHFCPADACGVLCKDPSPSQNFHYATANTSANTTTSLLPMQF